MCLASGRCLHWGSWLTHSVTLAVCLSDSDNLSVSSSLIFSLCHVLYFYLSILCPFLFIFLFPVFLLAVLHKMPFLFLHRWLLVSISIPSSLPLSPSLICVFVSLLLSVNPLWCRCHFPVNIVLWLFPRSLSMPPSPFTQIPIP